MRPTTPGFVGARLKEAREARGLTAIALADLLQVSRQVVSDYEQDNKAPGPAVMKKICENLHMPYIFFLDSREDRVPEDSPIFYRSLSSATKIARVRAQRRFVWLCDIVSFLSKFVDFPKVNLPILNLPEDPIQLSNEMIEDAATQVRRFWGLKDGPISNVIWLLENHGVIMGQLALGAETLDAFSQWISGRPYVILGTDKKCASRSRFDAAHELGHLVLHRNLSPRQLTNSAIFSHIEQQAHRFASAFLFPKNSFLEEFYLPNLDALQVLKSRWKLSIAMMIKRAEDLSCISRETAENMWRNYSRRGWKRAEPLDDELQPEEPKLLKAALRLLIDKKIICPADILEDLKLSSRDIEDLIDLHLGYLESIPPGVTVLKPRASTESKSGAFTGPGDLLTWPSNRTSKLD